MGKVRVELEEHDLDAGAGCTISKGTGDTEEWQIHQGWGRRGGGPAAIQRDLNRQRIGLTGTW